MNRSSKALRLGVAAVVAAAALAGCGASPRSEANFLPPAAPAPVLPVAASPGASVAGIPALSSNATDMSVEVKAKPGAGAPVDELLTQDVVIGTGRSATLADNVSVRYSGTLYDGTVFDTSWTEGNKPITFLRDGVIKGFARGMVGMQPGGRRVIVIPPDLGYGYVDKGPIPAASTLVFVVDMVSVGT